MWCVAELDEQYIARMEDVLAVYEKPLSVREPVVCIDEKPVVLHQEVRPPVAMQPGRVARRDAEYRRCGTANVFCGVQPKAGRHFRIFGAIRLGSSREFIASESGFAFWSLSSTTPPLLQTRLRTRILYRRTCSRRSWNAPRC